MKLSEITIGVVDGGWAKVGAKWGFKWPVGFALSAAPAEPGWVIQMVNLRYRTWVNTGDKRTFHLNKLRLAGGQLADRPEETYWEAWPVKAGDRNIHRPTADRGASASIMLYPDEYLVAPDPDKGEEDSAGEILVTGRVALYTGDLPDYFQPNQGLGGVLLQSRQKPDFWVDGAGSVHDLCATWNNGSLLRFQTNPPAANPVKSQTWPTW